MVVTVLSGKGGTGKTLVATALALSAARCTYADLDVEEPNGAILLKPVITRTIPFGVPIPVVDHATCSFCRKCADACAYSALTVIPHLKKVLFYPELCHSCGHCVYVCPVQGAITEEEKEIGTIRSGHVKKIRFIEGKIHVGVPSGVPLISHLVDQIIHNRDLTFIDAPPGSSCPVVESVRRSDCALLVTEPTPFGLSDLKLVAEMARDLGKSAYIVVNKDTGNTIIDDFAAANQIPILLKIPYSIRIQKDYARGIPLVETDTKFLAELKSMIVKMSSAHETV